MVGARTASKDTAVRYEVVIKKVLMYVELWRSVQRARIRLRKVEGDGNGRFRS